jgi:hypothetical protein
MGGGCAFALAQFFYRKFFRTTRRAEELPCDSSRLGFVLVEISGWGGNDARLEVESRAVWGDASRRVGQRISDNGGESATLSRLGFGSAGDDEPRQLLQL